MKSIMQLADELSEMHRGFVEGNICLREIKTEAEETRQKAIAAVNAAFEQFNRSMEAQIAKMEKILGE